MSHKRVKSDVTESSISNKEQPITSNIYVKHKETELRSLIDQITARTGDRAANEKKLKRLEESERLLRAENQE